MIVDSFEKFKELKPEWHSLLNQSESASFFLTWEWLFSWAELCLDDSRSLFILTIYDDKSLIGIAPLYLDQKKSGLFQLRELRFLGTPESGSDYLDVIIYKKREKEVAEALYSFLTGSSQHRWDQLVLTDIRAESLFLLYFMNCLEVDGKYVELTRSAICPFTKVPESVDMFYKSISPEWRKKYKQATRVCRRDYDVSHIVYPGHEAAGHLDMFFNLYEQKLVASPLLRRLLKQLTARYADAPPLQLEFLVVDGIPLAALLHFGYRKTLSMYLMWVDKTFNPKISFGNILVGLSIINCIGSHYAVYDFLKGVEPYKFHWASAVQPTLQLRFSQKKPGALLSASSLISRNMAKLLFR